MVLELDVFGVCLFGFRLNVFFFLEFLGFRVCRVIVFLGV